MAMTKCKECGQQRSTKADQCPHCGVKIRKTSLFTWFMAFVMGFFLIGFIGTLSETNPSQVQRTSSGTSTSITLYAHGDVNLRREPSTDAEIVGGLSRGDTVRISSSVNAQWGKVAGRENTYVYLPVLEREPIPSYEVVSWNWTKDRNFGGEGSVIYTAEVRNNTNRYVDNVRLEFATYDADGDIMTSDFTYAKGLAPGGTASTKGYATYYGSEEKATIRVTQ